MVTILNASTLNWAEGANESNDDVSQSAVHNSKSRFNTLLHRRRNYVGHHHHHHNQQQTTSSTLLSRGFLALFRKYQQYSFVTVDDSVAPATDADIPTLTVRLLLPYTMQISSVYFVQ